MVLAFALQPVVAPGRWRRVKLRANFDDRTLIRLAWLAPLVLLGLNFWRGSLNVPYLPTRVAAADLSLQRLEPLLADWAKTLPHQNGRMQWVAIVDPACPCTGPALRALQELLAKAPANTSTDTPPNTYASTAADTPRNSPQLADIEVAELFAQGSSAARGLLAEIPATPTLLVMAEGKLRYAGPITEGGACGAAVRQLLTSKVVSTPSAPTLRNVAASGCYCRLRTSYTGNTGSPAPQLSTTPQPRVS